MAEYPTRQFSASDAYGSYMQALEDEEKKKKAYNIVHHMYNLTNPRYAGSSEEASNLSKISKLGSGTSSGLATRLRLMTAADKENLGVEFTGAFQEALEGDLFSSLASFNTWANKQGPWYDEDLRRKHATTVKDLLAAQQSSKVAEAVDTLFAEYNDEWITGSYTEQNQVRQNIADSAAIKGLPSKWRATAMDEVIKMLNSFLSPTGQYAAGEQQMKKEKWAATQKKTKADEDKERATTNRKTTARSGAYRLFEYMKTAEEAPGIGLGLSFNDAKDKVTEEMEGTVWDRKEFDDVVKTLRREDPPTPPGTKKAYDASTGETIFATDAEIAANDNLVPEESNLEKDFAQVGRWLLASGTIKPEVWDRYRLMDQKEFDAALSISGPDQELLFSWVMEVNKRRERAATKQGINVQMLLPNASGQATGKTDDGLSNVRIKTN